jgi:Spy/CpxP family protein refolding chaperone
VNRAQWKAVFLLSGVFLLGSVAGIGGTLSYVAKERAELRRFDFGKRGEMPLQALTRRLDLTDTQRQQVKTLLERHGPERRRAMQEVMTTCGASMREEKSKLDNEIRAILTPEQKTRFDEISARQGERLFAPFEQGPFEHGKGGPGHGRGRR